MTTLVDAPAQATPPAPPAPPAARVELRRTTGGLRRSDVLAMIGGLVSSLCVTILLFQVIAPFRGRLGFFVVAWVLFLALYGLLVSFDEDGPAVRDRMVAAVVTSSALVLLGALVHMVVYTVERGVEALVHSNFYTQDLLHAGPLEPLTVGGSVHALIGTLEQITLALLIVIPLGITCAVFLREVPGRFGTIVRSVAEAMTALPSIVAGLFIYATLILTLGFERSGFCASLAIGVMMLPIIIRASDVVLRLVPSSLTEASLALGASQWRTVWHVVLPTARSGLATAVILGTARGIGETSPVLLTAGFTASTNLNPFKSDQVSLPLLVFDLVKSPSATSITRGFGTAVLLLALVLLLFVVARIIGGRGPGQLTRRQQRRRAAASRKDVARMTPPPARPAVGSST